MLQIHSSLEKAHDEWMETFEHNCKFVPHDLWKTDFFLKTFLNVLWYSAIVNCHTPWAVAACSGMQSEKKALTLAVIQIAIYLVYRRVHAPLTDCKLSLIIVLYEPGVNVLHFCEDRDIVLAHIWMLQCSKLAKVQLFWRCTHSLMIS